MLHRCEVAHANHHDRANSKHCEGQGPALYKGDDEARDAHAECVQDLTILLTDTRLDLIALLTDAGGELKIVGLIVPGAFLVKNFLQIKRLQFGGNACCRAH